MKATITISKTGYNHTSITTITNKFSRHKDQRQTLTHHVFYYDKLMDAYEDLKNAADKLKEDPDTKTSTRYVKSRLLTYDAATAVIQRAAC